MPFITITSNQSISETNKSILKNEIGNIISLIPHKTKKWLMCSFLFEQDLWMSDSNAPAAIVEIKLFGKVSKEVFSDITQKLSILVNQMLNIPLDRIYVTCIETPLWGWNGAPL